MSRLSLLILISALISWSACSSSGSSSSVSAASTTVPSAVVLSSPTEAASGDANISALVKALEGDPASDKFEDKKEALENLINGTGDCAFTINIPSVDTPTCYGPRVNYTNHPGGGAGQLPPGDVGIWSEYEGASDDASSEACAAAQMNHLIKKVASRTDNMIKLVGATACAGKKADISLPAIDDTALDLKSIIEDQVTASGMTITTATLDRLADDVDGNAQYRTILDVTFVIGDSSKTGKVILTHIPLDADNTNYKGKLSMSFSDEASSPGNCSFGTTGGTYTTVVLYEKNSSSTVEYQMDYAEFCGSSTDPFDADYNIDPADKATALNPTGWGSNWHHGRFSLSSTNGSGSVMYAWQAGAADNATRVLNVTTTTADSGASTGDAYYGFGPDVTSASAGSINGFICNWTGPGQTKGVGNVTPDSLVQFQGLTRAADGTVFRSDSGALQITYAPTNSCDYAGGAFTYESADLDSSTLDNTGGALVTNDLMALSTYQTDFTALTALEDI